jgi:hypothetical protein
MHSPRHILRTAGYAADVPKRVLWAAGLVPMLLVLGLVAAVWSRFGNVPVDDRLVRIMFVGLAALTVPHMVLVERVRLSGWNNRNDGEQLPTPDFLPPSCGLRTDNLTQLAGPKAFTHDRDKTHRTPDRA